MSATDKSSGASADCLDLQCRPCLGRAVKLKHDRVRDCHVMLLPEVVVKLNDTSYGILSRCDGATTLKEIVDDLEQEFSTSGIEKEVRSFLSDMVGRGWVVLAELHEAPA